MQSLSPPKPCLCSDPRQHPREDVSRRQARGRDPSVWKGKQTNGFGFCKVNPNATHELCGAKSPVLGISPGQAHGQLGEGALMPGPWQRQLLPGAGRQGMLLHQPARCFLGAGSSRGANPGGQRPPVPNPLPGLGLGRRAQQAAPGHRRSYKLFGHVYKRANPCSHCTGFVPSPEPSLTINRGWVSSKVCSICYLLSENRSPFRIQESARKAEIFVNTIMVILID